MQTPQKAGINLKFVLDCVEAYSKSTGIGCVVSDSDGAVLYESGFCCGNCAICGVIGFEKVNCPGIGLGNWNGNANCEGKYIYLCPMGLGNISSTIPVPSGNVASITAGPFLMIDMEDFFAFDLKENFALEESKFKQAVELLGQIPKVSPERVGSLFNLLSLLAGHMWNISSGNRAFEARSEDFEILQEPAPDNMLKKYEGSDFSEYPVKTEKKLLASIAESDRPRVQKLLNELLGHIFLSSDEDFERIKTETYELLVVISRGAIDVGVPRSRILQMNRTFWWQAQSVTSIYGLCMLLTDVINRYIDNIFDYASKKNLDVIYRAVQYIRQNYSSKITLEDVAKAVYLSPTYLCKIFKKEVGCNFNEYLNKLRIEKSKQLLAQHGSSIADIMTVVGFDDQSYFTKVFKRVAGVSPKHFRKSAEAVQTA
jgi:AraC-like DNA-binding protein